MTDVEIGHGWVNPRADRAVARCGGPAICRECATEVCRECGLVGTEAMAAHRSKPLEEWKDGVPV